MKYSLPEDIKKYEKEHKIWGLIVSVVIIAAAVGALAMLIVLTLDKGAAHVALLSAFYIIIVAGILMWSKIPKRFIDKTFCGKIKEVSVYSRRRSYDPARPTRESFRTYHTVKLKVETPDGSTVGHEVTTLRHSAASVIEEYKEGDEVFHLYGTDVTVMLPNGTDAFVFCPVCGESNHVETDACRKCGHTLIKSVDDVCKK